MWNCGDVTVGSGAGVAHRLATTACEQNRNNSDSRHVAGPVVTLVGDELGVDCGNGVPALREKSSNGFGVPTRLFAANSNSSVNQAGSSNSFGTCCTQSQHHSSAKQ